MNIKNVIGMAGVLSVGLLVAESFVLPPAKRRLSKVSAEDCCQEIGSELKFHARIIQQTGKVQEMKYDLIDGVLEGDKKSLLKKANQQQLNAYLQHEKEFVEKQRVYEKAVNEHIKFLSDFEQHVSGAATRLR